MASLAKSHEGRTSKKRVVTIPRSAEIISEKEISFRRGMSGLRMNRRARPLFQLSDFGKTLPKLFDIDVDGKQLLHHLARN